MDSIIKPLCIKMKKKYLSGEPLNGLWGLSSMKGFGEINIIFIWSFRGKSLVIFITVSLRCLHPVGLLLIIVE